jgi:hypothetical protein
VATLRIRNAKVIRSPKENTFAIQKFDHMNFFSGLSALSSDLHAEDNKTGAADGPRLDQICMVVVSLYSTKFVQ